MPDDKNSFLVEIESQTRPKDGSSPEEHEIEFRCFEDHIWIDVDGAPKVRIHISDDLEGAETIKVITFDSDGKLECGFDLGPI